MVTEFKCSMLDLIMLTFHIEIPFIQIKNLCQRWGKGKLDCLDLF